MAFSLETLETARHEEWVRFGTIVAHGEYGTPPVRDETAHEWGTRDATGGAPGHKGKLIRVRHLPNRVYAHLRSDGLA